MVDHQTREQLGLLWTQLQNTTGSALREMRSNLPSEVTLAVSLQPFDEVFGAESNATVPDELLPGFALKA